MVQETDQWDIFYVIFALCVHAVNCMNFLPRFKLWVRLESRNKLKRLTRANIYLRVIAAISSYQNSLVVITWILAKIIKNELWALARGILDFYSWFTGILGLLGKILELHETRLWSTTKSVQLGCSLYSKAHWLERRFGKVWNSLFFLRRRYLGHWNVDTVS